MSWFNSLFGIKTDKEIVNGVEEEPTIRNARKALKRARSILGEANGMLADAEEAEEDRLAAIERHEQL